MVFILKPSNEVIPIQKLSFTIMEYGDDMYPFCIMITSIERHIMKHHLKTTLYTHWMGKEI